MKDSKYPDKEKPYSRTCVECKHLRNEPYGDYSCERADVVTYSREFGKRIAYSNLDKSIDECEKEDWFEPALWYSVLVKLKSLNKCEVVSLMLLVFVVTLVLML